MLQRFQSVFLFLISLVSALMIFIPFQRINTPDICYVLYLNPANIAEGVKPLIYLPFFLNVLVIVLSLMAIFLYKNRQLQMKLCTLTALLSFGLTACMLSLNYIDLPVQSEIAVTYAFASFFPLVNIILAFVAKRLIRSDEELVKSADRIR